MSQYEIEDAVEASLRALDVLLGQTPEANREFRDLACSLYAFEGLFDCSYTQLRVEEILRRRGFLVAMALAEHPRAEEIAHAALDGDGWLELEDGAPALLKEGVLFFEAGSSLWSSLVEAARIPAEQASAPQAVPLLQVVERVLAAPVSAPDALYLARAWYTLLPIGLQFTGEPEQLDQAPAQALRLNMRERGVHNMRGEDWPHALQIPSQEELADYEDPCPELMRWFAD